MCQPDIFQQYYLRVVVIESNSSLLTAYEACNLPSSDLRNVFSLEINIKTSLIHAIESILQIKDY